MKTILVSHALSHLALLISCVFTVPTIQAADKPCATKPRMTAPKVLEKINRLKSGIIVHEVQRGDEVTWVTENGLDEADVILRTFETVRPSNPNINPYLQDRRPSRWGLSCEEDFEPPLYAILAHFIAFIDEKRILRLVRLELGDGRIYWEPFEVFIQRETTFCQQCYNQACCPWYTYGCFGMSCSTDQSKNDLPQTGCAYSPYRNCTLYEVNLKKRKPPITNPHPSNIFQKQLHRDMSVYCVCCWSATLTLIEDNFSRIAESLWS